MSTTSLRTRLLALLVGVFALLAGMAALQARDRLHESLAAATFQLERESRLLLATQEAFAGRADRLVGELAEQVAAAHARGDESCPGNLASYLGVARGFVDLAFAMPPVRSSARRRRPPRPSTCRLGPSSCRRAASAG